MSPMPAVRSDGSADAIGDPIAGLYAAASAPASYASGGGELIDVSTRRAVAYAAGVPLHPGPHRVDRESDNGWRLTCAERGCRPVALPGRPPLDGWARLMGSDTTRVLAELESADAP